jgi:hypothetical protein
MKRFFSVIAFLFVINVFSLSISHGLHKWGRTNHTVYGVVMTLDLMDFISNGGGFCGASLNYFGWSYSKATANPNRPLWHKLLIWPNPYYITIPPDKWPYEYQGG